MRLSLSLGTVAACVGAGWLAVNFAVPRRSADAGVFTLEVPATYLSVGQQIRPRLARPGDAFGDGPTVTLALKNAAGATISTQQARLSGTGVSFAPIALPRAGRYELRAMGGAQPQVLTLQAMAAPDASFGGVTALDELGMPAGAAAYLRAHGFVINPVTSPGDFPGVRLYLVGDARLGLAPAVQASVYAELWRRVGAGGQVLLLNPPPPGVAPYWPLEAPVAAAAGGCTDDLFDPAFNRGLDTSSLAALLQPSLAYDLRAQKLLDLYHWNGYRLPMLTGNTGYGGCHPLFSYRYGSGWVTVSTVPLLQRFQDVRARIYLMNLIQASLQRKHVVPPSPGLQWVMQQRLKKLEKDPGPPFTLAAAAYFEPPAAAVAPAPQLVPALTDGNPHSCWTSPRASGRLRLDFDRALSVSQLELNFGADRAEWPSSLTLEASNDGIHWQPLPQGTLSPAAINPQGVWTLPVSGEGIKPGAYWRAFRLTPPASGPAWRLCEWTAQ